MSPKSHPAELPLEPLPLEPPLPSEAQAAPSPVAANEPVGQWTSPSEVTMRLSAEQLRELEADDDFKLMPPEMKPAQILAQLEKRQQTKPVPQPINPFLDEAPRVIGEKTVSEEAVPREPWQFSLQEMCWASLIVLVGVAFTRAILSHPVFLALGILAWCAVFVLARLHFRDPERVDWLAVQAVGFTYISILWVGWTF
jgi:hypothetical protein